MASNGSGLQQHNTRDQTALTTATATLDAYPQNSLAGGHLSSHDQLAVWSTRVPDHVVNMFSGAMAGLASGIVTCPLDVIKTKLQAQGSFSARGKPASAIYHGLAGTARTIIRQDGLVGMYRGLGPMLLGYLPTWAVYMTVYDASRNYLYANGFDRDDNTKFLARVYASVMGGACSTLTTNPIWVVKTRLMSQTSAGAKNTTRTPWHYTGTFDAFRKMYRAEGIGSFYSGLTPALLGLAHVAIQFPLYEYLKTKFTGQELGQSSMDSDKSAKEVVGILAATLISKICASSATYPHEVLRTRLQTQQRVAPIHDSTLDTSSRGHASTSTGKLIGNTDGVAYTPRYRGVFSAILTILREEGWRAFYNGMGTNMVRAVPAAMTTMLAFETMKGYLLRLKEEGRYIQAGHSP